MSRPAGPLGMVMGDVDLVWALALGGIRSALYAPPLAPARYSRNVVATVPWHDQWSAPEAAAAAIADFAATRDEAPVLFPQGDGELLLASRHRDLLGRSCRSLLADADTIEALVHKARFADLAARLELPTPRSRHIDACVDRPEDLDLRPPLVLKPTLRDQDRWSPVEPEAKALHVPDREALHALWPQLAELDLTVVAQEAVPGPESAIESYHAYIAADGTFVAGFTGRKIRTWPLRYGHSTALRLTDAADVATRGREVLDRLALRGVAKVDFKRAPDGGLHLLEVNPRFTLWLHLAARAGLNIPAIFHADVAGLPRPAFGPARPGLTWCLPYSDLRASRADGVGLRSWLGFLSRCDARSGLWARDPLVFFPGVVWHRIARRSAG